MNIVNKRNKRIICLAVALTGGNVAFLDGTAAAETPLSIMASPTPHAEILHYVEDHFKDAPPLKIIEITGQTDPNEPLAGGDIDANYFQHVPFLNDDQKHLSTPLKVVATVHLEPLGIYSSRHHSLKELPDGARIGIPNNPTNLARALRLLQDNGLIKLRKGIDGLAATEKDVADNPHHLNIVPTDAPLLARALPDFDAAIINGNFALEAGLSPVKDALVLEKAQNNPYANVLVTRVDNASDPRVQKLAQELSSPDVARYIKEHYKGAVIPVHGTTASDANFSTPCH